MGYLLSGTTFMFSSQFNCRPLPLNNKGFCAFKSKFISWPANVAGVDIKDFNYSLLRQPLDVLVTCQKELSII